MRRSRIFHAAVCVVLAGVVLLVPDSPAHAATSARHCAVAVVGSRPSGEFITSAPRCYETFEAAMQSAGVNTAGLPQASPDALASAGRLQSATSSIIGIHYDGAGWTGGSFTVYGATCSGGWLNVALVWNDRISSTLNGCPRIRHFWDTNLGGTSQDTTGGGGNLTVLNNRTSSIQYLT